MRPLFLFQVNSSARAILWLMITKFALVLCLAGLGMFVTGLLPRDTMNAVRAFLGDKEERKNQPPVRVQLLFCGAICIFFGLLMLGVIRL